MSDEDTQAPAVDNANEEEIPDIDLLSPEASGVDEEQEPKPVEENTEAKVEEAEQTEATAPKEGEEAAEEQTTEPEQPKETEAERNARFYAERQAQKRQVEQKINETYQPQKADELVQKYTEQGYDEFQATMLADKEQRDQQAQINQVRTEIAELNMQIETEALQVMNDFPVFRELNPDGSKNPDYDKDFAVKASELYQRAANPQVDKNTGLIIQAAQTPYQFYKDLHDMRKSGMSQAQIKAQKAVEQQMAAVAPPTSSYSANNDDSLEALEERLGNVRIA